MMNPVMIVGLLEQLLAASASLKTAYDEAKGGLSAQDQADLDARIEAAEASRQASWKAADAALDAAAQHP